MSSVAVKSAAYNADVAVTRIGDKAHDLADAIRAEQQAIAERDDYLSALVNSIIGSPNPLTGKPHSLSSAEAAAKEDARYKELAAARTEAECARVLYSAYYDMAKLTARLHVAIVEQGV